MDDLISRKAAIDRIKRQMERPDSVGQWAHNDKIAKVCYRIVIEILERLPSAEPEIIVRCKECKHSEAETDTSGKTGLICHATYDEYGCWVDVKPEHFCGYAERRTDE